jgi:aspergillopepsin I
VQGSNWKALRGGFTFPCDSKLPDLTIMMGEGKNVTVPGINMNYQSISATTCYGGLQRSDVGGPKDELHIAGGTFLKNLFVAFEHPLGGNARLGFARQA